MNGNVRKQLQEINKVLEGTPVEATMVQGKKHPKVTLTNTATGRKALVVISGSPSDVRSITNALALVKRKLNELTGVN